MTSEAVIDFLADHSLLRGIPAEELRHAAALIERAAFRDGELLLAEGDEAKDCYFVMSGAVNVSSRNLVGKMLLLAELGPGALVGEIGLMRNERRSASVTAVGDVEALRLDRRAFEYLAERSPLFYESMLVTVRIRMIHSQLRKATVWSAIPDAELRGLAEITTIRRAAKGEVIVAEGDRAGRFYMVSHGRLELRGGNKRKTVLHAGDYVGEAGLLTNTPAERTLVALEPCELLVMGRDEFLYILNYYAPVRRQFLEILRIRSPHLAASAIVDAGETASVPDRNDVLPRAQDKWIDLLLWLGGGFLALSVLALFLHGSGWRIAALLVGGIVGPASFVAYVRNQQLLGFRQSRLGMIFAATAIVAIPLAWVLERMWLFGSAADAGGSAWSRVYVPLAVSLIEEGAKLLVVVLLVRSRQMRFLMDAVVFGAAAGMGFAAVESVIYGWAHLEQASSLGLLAVLWLRALLSPLGHGTWTAIAAAGLWYGTARSTADSLRPRPWLRAPRTAGLLTVAFALHALWDYHAASGLLRAVMMAAVGGAGLYALMLLIRSGRREEFRVLHTLNPYLQETGQHEGNSSESEPARGELKCEGCGTLSPRETRYCPRCGQALRMKRHG